MSDDETHLRMLPAPHRSGDSYSADVREETYRLWAYSYGQNSEQLGKYLDIPPFTIRRWVHRDGWVARLGVELADAFPHYRASTQFSLVLGARDGAAYLTRVVTGEVPPDKTRVIAAFGLLDRAGYGPTMRTKDDQPDAPTFVVSTADTQASAQATLDRVRAERDALTFKPEVD